MRLPLHGVYTQIKTKLSTQLAIFMYHAVVRSPLEVSDPCFLDEASFRRQIEYLKDHFEVIPLSEGVERLANREVHRPTAVITFDDGFQNNYDIAFPILRETGMPATIFLVTGLVNTSDTLWYCRLNRALALTTNSPLKWDGCGFDLSGPRRKAKASEVIQAKLKRFPHPHLLARLRNLIVELGDDPDHPIQLDSPLRMLSQEAIAEMAASGLIEFGAHTHTHAILSLLSPEERYHEIERSITGVHELAGRPCELFSYPNGRAQDYDAGTVAILETYGLRASVTAIWGANDQTTPVMELRRYAFASTVGFRRAVYPLMFWHRIGWTIG